VQGYFFSPPVSQEALRERFETGIRIGLENPGETEYYDSISNINLQDPSMITKMEDLREDYSSYFRTLPMAVLEADDREAVIVRANRSYREFLNRYMGFHMEEGQQVAMPLTDPEIRSPFFEAIVRRRETGNWENIRESLSNGNTVHAFVRQISVNPVTGKAAIALIVLAVV